MNKKEDFGECIACTEKAIVKFCYIGAVIAFVHILTIIH